MIKTRIIETAIDDNGDSYIFSDKFQSGWNLGGHNITDMFFSEALPLDMLESSQQMEDKNFNLKPGQLRFFRSDIPPTKPLYDALLNSEKPADYRDLFYHSTTTVDFIMVSRGQVTMIVGDQDLILDPGSVVIQRGATHAWHNDTNEIAIIMGVMIGVELPEQFHQVDTIQPA